MCKNRLRLHVKVGFSLSVDGGQNRCQSRSTVEIMRGKNFGLTGQKAANTRDFSPKFGGIEHGSVGKKSKGNDGAYHVQGRPGTRKGNETDMRNI